MNYTPDSWVILKIAGNDPHYRVLGGWSGSYLYGTSWRMNSGIVKVEDAGDYFIFHGSSGSTYECRKGGYGIRTSMMEPISYYTKKHPDKVTVMDENTDWVGMFNNG
mgnify:CR=1 FL=1